MAPRGLVWVLVLACSADAYRILGLFPYAGKSHFDVFFPLMRALAERGNDVTVVSHFPQGSPIPNYRDVPLPPNSNLSRHLVNLGDIPPGRLVKYLTPVAISRLGRATCENLSHKPVLDLVQTKFDLVLIEQFDSDCFLGLVHLLQAPFIGITSHILMPWTNTRLANPDNPAYIPNHFLDYSDELGFAGRLENAVQYLVCQLVYKVFIEREDQEVIWRVLGPGVPRISAIAERVSLVLVNTHFSLNRPRPLVPGLVEVGGMHIGSSGGIKEQNIENWINGSKHGVIYFSMGSMIKGHTFPPNKRQAFLGAFGRLPQRVLWKWENDTMPGKPENVMIQKWMPQFDILCHPNVVAYISHGGLLGMTEAVHCGVPAVVLPQFGDQFTNARALQASGGGLVLDFNTLQEDQVYDALNTILAPEFQEKTKRLSERFRDRPMSPLDTAIYWVEYVARHKGAHHLRTAAVGMPWHQYLLLDVIAFLVLIPSLILYVSYLVCCKRKGLARGADKTKIKTN